MNKEIIGIFIDDSGKLYDKNEYVNYTGIVFKNLHNYWKFANQYNNCLKEVNNGIEIKGSKFWTKEINLDTKHKILKTLRKYEDTYIFSIVICKKRLIKTIKNDLDAEGVLNNCIAILCDYIVEELNLCNFCITLFIDEQVRKIFKTRNSLVEYLNYPYPKLQSIKRLRQRNIDFLCYENIKSHEWHGVMLADIIANGVNRLYNNWNSDYCKDIKDTIEICTGSSIKNFYWPKND